MATPKHTETLAAHFTDFATAQTKGLDDEGSPPTQGLKAITVEVVGGTREELYWLKVPEKLRRQAVEKAVKGLHFEDNSLDREQKRTVDGEPDVGGEQTRKSKKKRKR